MTNTRPVPNSDAPVVDTRTGKLLSPWIQFFQQFVQKAPTIVDISGLSPFQANQNGTIIITGGTGISITRGTITIALANGQAIIPIAISDIVTFASGTAKFLGQ